MQIALLLLEDGTEFWGEAIGNTGVTFGELIFNTSLTGYQEIITDPSYNNQIITFTYPHIGNVGINKQDNESYKSQIKGLVINKISLVFSNFRGMISLSEYLKQQKIIGISNIDTRKLTKLLYKKGTQNGYILSGNNLIKKRNLTLIKNLNINEIYRWTKGSFFCNKKKLKYKVVVYDYGIKKNILRMLVDRCCDLIVVPAFISAKDILKIKPDGIFLSNGPGDPSKLKYIINNIKILLKKNIPMFGICLGYQLLALASGGRTIKMKFGHHGSNHPVKNHITGKVMITSQNHGFTVDKKTLPNIFKITHSSLFDGTLQGLHHINKPIFGFQGHPEASPGTHDASILFDYFIKLINNFNLHIKYKDTNNA